MSAHSLSITAGKGGAGSTFFAVNLAVSLSRLDKNVLIVDLSHFGGGVPQLFGQNYRAEMSLNRVTPEKFHLPSVIKATDLKRVSYVQSFSDQWRSIPRDAEWARQYFNLCINSGFDFVIFDLGSNDLPYAASIFNTCDYRIMITTPDAASIEKSYRYLESVCMQNLAIGQGPEMANLIKTCIDEFRLKPKNGTITLLDFIQQRLPTLDGIDSLRDRNTHFVVNQCRARSDYDLGPALQSAMRKYYGLKSTLLGNLDSDNAVQQATRNQEPVLVGQPFAFVSGQFLTMSRNLLQMAAKSNFDSIRLKSVV